MVGTKAGLSAWARNWRNSATVRAMNMDYQACKALSGKLPSLTAAT